MLLTTMFCLGACAAPVETPESNNGAAVDAAVPPGSLEPESMDSPQGDQASSDQIDVVDVPPIEETDVRIAKSIGSERVCRREIRTGTHRAVRVCRTRDEIERMEQESKNTFRDLNRSQREYP